MTLTPIHEPIVITQYRVLLDDIEEAKKEQIATFAYETKEGDKAARSYLFQLRKLRARIESARKDAKAYALAYGKQVDNQAKELSSQVDELIEPHQEQLEAIARRETYRVRAHQAVLDLAVDYGQVRFGENSTEIQHRLFLLDKISLEGLEEFTEKVAAAIVTSRQALQQALLQAIAAEAQAHELAKLKAEQQEREAKEKEERIKREAQEKADAEAAAAAFDAIAAAERRAAEAEAKVREAEAMAAQAELAKLSPVQPITSETKPAPVELENGTLEVEIGVVAVDGRQAHARRRRLIVALAEVTKGMNRVDFIHALVDGQLHPALQINWGAVQ
jgi:RNA-binding protein YhbY